MLKDATIQGALHHLEARFGKDAFQIVDHWQGDLLAIGIASLSDAHRLVYIAARGQGTQRYDALLEQKPMPDSQLLFAPCGEFENIGLDELARIVSNHLRMGDC